LEVAVASQIAILAAGRESLGSLTPASIKTKGFYKSDGLIII